MPSRALLIGLDCAAPALVFERWADQLPHLTALARGGLACPLRSTHPPITVPAWAAMMSGQDPGVLGLYGFRNRPDHSYSAMVTANASALQVPMLWDRLGERGLASIVVGVPPSYPPRPLRGIQVGCFLTPDNSTAYTWPRAVKALLEELTGGYPLDVRNFRQADKLALRDAIADGTRKRFLAFRTLLRTRPWDFAMCVEMGVDRMHHGFWRFMDPAHPAYQAGHPLEHAIRDYYRLVDAEVGQLLAEVPEDTLVMVVSDHGARLMEGGICVNELFRREGLLTLHQAPAGLTPFHPDRVDWSRTVAWGEGGYYARIYLNVAGREPQGVVDPADYEGVRERVKTLLETLPDEAGRPLGSRVYRPETLYRQVKGVAPDLLAYFGDLRWRSVASVGGASVWTRENDTGPDDANHDHLGICILRDPSRDHLRGERPAERSIYDVTPTLLTHFGLPVPAELRGQSLIAGDVAG